MPPNQDAILSVDYHLEHLEIAGRRHYLGTCGSTESRQAYHRLIAETLGGVTAVPASAKQITVIEITSRYPATQIPLLFSALSHFLPITSLNTPFYHAQFT